MAVMDKEKLAGRVKDYLSSKKPDGAEGGEFGDASPAHGESVLKAIKDGDATALEKAIQACASKTSY